MVEDFEKSSVALKEPIIIQCERSGGGTVEKCKIGSVVCKEMRCNYIK